MRGMKIVLSNSRESFVLQNHLRIPPHPAPDREVSQREMPGRCNISPLSHNGGIKARKKFEFRDSSFISFAMSRRHQRSRLRCRRSPLEGVGQSDRVLQEQGLLSVCQCAFDCPERPPDG